MKGRWRLIGAFLFLPGLVATTIGTSLIVADAQVLGPGDQIRICHSAPPDAYVYHGSETPAIDSIVKGEGHDQHPADIIPPFDYSGISGDIYHGHYPGKNWTSAGQAIWNNDCKGGVATQTATTVYNNATKAPLGGGALPNGGSVYDIAKVTPVGLPLMGTVSFLFFANGACSGTGTSAGSGQVSSTTGMVQSSVKGPLTTAGSYAFMATFTDGDNFKTSSSACEPFTVAGPPKTDTTTSTIVFNASTDQPLGTAILPNNGSVYDRATVAPKTGSGSPTGTINYTFFANGGCSGNGTPAGSGNQSNTQSGLAGGSYSFQATYLGDANFNGSTSACEAFSVAKADTTVSTTVFDADSNQPLSGGMVASGGSVYDLAAVNHTGGPAPTGTVTYTFFHNGECEDGSLAGTVSVGTQSLTQGPLNPGTYSFNATYSGDQHYNGMTSPCEKFKVSETPKIETKVTTTIHDATTNQPVTTLAAGGTVYDLAAVAPKTGSGTPTGTVTYTFFQNGECEDGTSAGTVTVGQKSMNQGPLAVGSYSFEATYNGDGTFKRSTSECEHLTVTKAETNLTTTVYDASTNQPLSGSLAAGGSVYDLATVDHTGGLTPTGTVTYTFFHNNECEEDANITGTVPVGDKSSTQGPLVPGSYSFKAVYSGDGNFEESKSKCEPFTVSKASTTVTTVVFDNSTNQPLTNDTLAEGGTVYDLATVNHSGSGTPTGTVTYTFFHNAGCTGDGSSAGTVAVGTKSSTEGPLTAGSYSFKAKYNGDSNFASKTSLCEPFTVLAAGQTTVTTVVFDASTNQPLSGATIGAGGSVYDVATVNHSGSGTPTGNVTYTFFHTGDCSGTGSPAGTVQVGTKSSTQASLAAGTYSFNATYAGDTNFKGSTSACEPFTVTAATGGAPPVSGPTPTPQGEILAETGANPPGLGLGIGLMLAGFVAMVAGALFWRRQRA